MIENKDGRKGMKAVIMAGGEGSRLRPLTLDLPKPLARLCGKPILEYILELLSQHGIRECAITVGYLQEKIREYMESRPEDGMQIELVGEPSPLGTAGSVRAAAGDEEEVLVISGDAMCDIDLTAAIERHHRSGAAVTVVVRHVDDPREYGLALCTPQGMVAGFVEKPPLSQAMTDLANTGIYIVGREALDMIPVGKKYDFAGDLFPRLLAAHCPIAAYETRGYWCDIGELESYLQCQYDLLEGRVRANLPKKGQEGTGMPSCCEGDSPSVEGAVYWGKNVTLGRQVRVSGPCIIEDGVSIGDGAVIRGGVILEGAYIGEGARIQEAIVCHRASLKRGVCLEEYSTVGPGAVLGDFCRVAAGVKIWSGRRVPAHTVVSSHLIRQSGKAGIFDDEGITGEVGVELTPELFVRLGCAVGSQDPGRSVAVGCCEDKSTRALRDAMISGIQSSGAQVLDFGALYRSLFDFCLDYTGSRLGAYVSCSRAGNQVRLLGEHALGCPRGVERGIEGILARGEFLRADSAHYGERVSMENMQILYASELLRHAPFGLGSVRAQVESPNRQIASLMRETLEGLGCAYGGGERFWIDQNGTELRLECEGVGTLSHPQLVCMLALAEMLSGRDIALPYSAPHLIDELAARHGRRVLRYYDCPVGEVDSRARTLASEQKYFRDALMMCICLLAFTKTSGMTLAELYRQLPPQSFMERELFGVMKPAAIMNSLHGTFEGTLGEGVLLTHRLGLALVRPSKKGDRIRVFAESRSPEMAQELCADILERLSRINQEILDNANG